MMQISQSINRIKVRRNAMGVFSRQRGAIMVVALMLLLVMTILSLSGISNSTLETRMARNYHQGSSAFQNAEFGLRVAEEWLVQNVTTTALIDNYFFDTTANNGLYTTQEMTPSDEVFNEICGGDIDCLFEPMDVDQWCTGGSCKLPQGFVTLGDNLEGVNLPFLDEDLPVARRTRQPQFVIEYVGPEDVQQNIERGSKKVYSLSGSAFRITVIAWGQDQAARQVLQSHVILPVLPPTS